MGFPIIINHPAIGVPPWLWKPPFLVCFFAPLQQQAHVKMFRYLVGKTYPDFLGPGHFLVNKKKTEKNKPRCSMHGIFHYIWDIFGVNVGKYSSTMGCIWETFPTWRIPFHLEKYGFKKILVIWQKVPIPWTIHDYSTYKSLVEPQLITGGWLGHPSEKYESQLGWWNSQYMGK